MILPVPIHPGFQPLGEIAARGFGRPLAGPVLGIAFLFLAPLPAPPLIAILTH